MSGPDSSLKLLQALNDRDKTTVSECTKNRSVKKWIDKRVDVKQIKNSNISFASHVKDITCLGFASRNSDTRTVHQLVRAGADVTATDSSGRTPLHWACESDIQVKQKVEYLLSCDASLLGARDNSNSTPLNTAALSGNDAVVSVFIQHGASVNEQGEFDRTALHGACNYGHVACINELMRHGADVEARDSERGATPLQLASLFNRPQCVKVLLDKYRALINATNAFGVTALHQAAYAGNLDVVKLLTSYSQCDVNAKDDAGKTSADCARDKGHMDVADYLASISSVASVAALLPSKQSVDIVFFFKFLLQCIEVKEK